MKKYMALVVLILMLCPAVSYAASPWTTAEGGYSGKIKAKLDFGVKNTFFGLTEVVNAPKRLSDDDKKNLFKVLGVGVFNAAADEVGGFVHAVTFFIPAIDIPLPNNGVQI